LLPDAFRICLEPPSRLAASNQFMPYYRITGLMLFDVICK